MRTATTLFKTAKGWSLAAGPDVPFEKQRRDFNGLGTAWPEGVSKVRWQPNDGAARERGRDKAEAMVTQMEQANKRADEKAALAKKLESDAQSARDKEAAAKHKADIEAREKASKKPAK